MAELVYDLLVMGLGGAFQNLLTGFGHDLLLQNILISPSFFQLSHHRLLNLVP